MILVTEPTVSGLHDLQRVSELVGKFRIRSGCIVNKADLNRHKRDEIHAYLKQNNIDHLADIPYDETFTRAMVSGKTMTEFTGSRVREILESTWNKIINK
ncbi:MAG: hypothetical protein U5N26_12215 [Candidatus Marinimicrobia bacterium]|nr:hypothetical protein [Candidatus Neomarinimicrobiota bacterium]